MVGKGLNPPYKIPSAYGYSLGSYMHYREHLTPPQPPACGSLLLILLPLAKDNYLSVRPSLTSSSFASFSPRNGDTSGQRIRDLEISFRSSVVHCWSSFTDRTPIRAASRLGSAAIFEELIAALHTWTRKHVQEWKPITDAPPRLRKHGMADNTSTLSATENPPL